MTMPRLRPLRAAALALLLVGTACADTNGAAPPAAGSGEAGSGYVMAIHGGGGVLDRADMTPELEAEYREALKAALAAGREVLEADGDSVSAVEAAVRVLEDSPLFNAARGGSYNAEGIHEFDASIMDGSTHEAGAVAVVQEVKNPVTLARRVMEQSPHVLIAGAGALEFAKAQGVELRPPEYFFTQRRWDSLQRRLNQSTPYGEQPGEEAGAEASAVSDRIGARGESLDRALFGTVGAVARDRDGNLAAATSTGGREGKLPGRVGDSPIIGAGTYADNATLAASSTGLGEYVIRTVGTKTISDLMAYRGLGVEEASNIVVERIKQMGGGIGVIAVDRDGNVAMPFSGDGMYRGYVREGDESVVEIYR
ncbi:MAG: isoaspartyl peptidase/L-asparaginase family protein [Luteimonas sp.]